MQGNSFKVFLTDYIGSLAERTRVEKTTVKIGFDWLIYQIALAKDWVPIRLPFIRQSGDRTARSKTEAEFGIDVQFLLPSRQALVIFVLKDEVLNSQNWTSHDFDRDLRMASTPDLEQQGLELLNSVRVILAYNKDEDRNGITLFDRIVASMPTAIRKNVILSFERWNLTTIVEEISLHLMSPELLPQHLSAQFRYICSQFRDFDYQTEEWRDQLIPNWVTFLRLALQDPVDERKLRLIPVMLMILNNYRKDSPGSYPGWIDMIEWAMLSMWSVYQKLSNTGKDQLLKSIVVEGWIKLYISELEKYLLSVADVFSTEHGFTGGGWGFGLPAVNDSYAAYWHLGRLGIFTLAPQDISFHDAEKHQEFISEIVMRSADWLVSCLRLNPASLRPLVDLNHIELFLIWLILWQAGKEEDIHKWLSELESRLLMRRAQKFISVPFIESRNRIDLVAEYAAVGKRPDEFIDSSSYLLLMILELCFSLNEPKRGELLNRYMRRIINGIGDDGKHIAEYQIDLVGWIPPEDWGSRILKERVLDGIAITMSNFESVHQEERPLCEKIKEYVTQTRLRYPWNKPDIPLAVLILACIKHRSPLPPEFWRGTIFPADDQAG